MTAGTFILVSGRLGDMYGYKLCTLLDICGLECFRCCVDLLD